MYGSTIPKSRAHHGKEICYTWTHMNGAAKIISFAVYDGSNSYELALNTKDFTWELGDVKSTP
jgi:hypothetical protein